MPRTMSPTTTPPPCTIGRTADTASGSTQLSEDSSTSTSTSTLASSYSSSDCTTSAPATAPTSTSSSACAPASNKDRPSKAQSKKKGKKAKGTVPKGGDEGRGPKHRLEWNSLPRALALLEENLAAYQKLDPKSEQRKRLELKSKVADMILNDGDLKTTLELKGHENEDVRHVRVSFRHYHDLVRLIPNISSLWPCGTRTTLAIRRREARNLA